MTAMHAATRMPQKLTPEIKEGPQGPSIFLASDAALSKHAIGRHRLDGYEQSAAGITEQVVVGVPPVGVKTDAAHDRVVKDPPVTVVLAPMAAAVEAPLTEAKSKTADD